MSRIRIVKGSITKTSGGKYSMYSDDNIEFSGKKVTLTSDKGVIFGTPDPAPELVWNEEKKELEQIEFESHEEREGFLREKTQEKLDELRRTSGIPNPAESVEEKEEEKEEKPKLQGHVIFCNGFLSDDDGAINAVFNYKPGLEEEPWYGRDGIHANHEGLGWFKTGNYTFAGRVSSEVYPADLDEDITDSDEIDAAQKKVKKASQKKPIVRRRRQPPGPNAVELKQQKLAALLLEKFRGYWSDYRNNNQGVDTYLAYFNAEGKDHYLNGSHGMGSPAWERMGHGISLGYYWAFTKWGIKKKQEVDRELDKGHEAVASYSPAYQPLTIVGHSQGCAPAVGACIGALYYAYEMGWDKVPVNLILLGTHQPVALWSDEVYDPNRAHAPKDGYNYYKWMMEEVLEVNHDSPRAIHELINNMKEVKEAVTPYGPAIASVFTKNKLKQPYGINEYAAELLGADGWAQLKARGVQFTFTNDRAVTVCRDGDIPGMANAASEKATTNMFPFWGDYGQSGYWKFRLKGFSQHMMDTRIRVDKDDPKKVTYKRTTYKRWVEEFVEAHAIYKKKAKEFKEKYNADWRTPSTFHRKRDRSGYYGYYIDDTLRRIYAAAEEVRSEHRRMMEKYVWVHHVELEAHFTPVAFMNRPEVFDVEVVRNSYARHRDWPGKEGSTIFQRILKKGEDIFYRVKYKGTSKDDVDDDTLFEEWKKKFKDKKDEDRKDEEIKYVRDGDNHEKLISTSIVYNDKIKQWIDFAKRELAGK